MRTDAPKISCSFGKGNPGSLFLAQGWEYPEVWGAKNADSISELHLPGISVDIEGCVAFNFYCCCKSKTTVHINGTCVATWYPSTSFSVHTVDHLGKELLAPVEPIVVKFQTEVPKSLEIASLWIQGCRFENSKSSPLASQNAFDGPAPQAPLFITGIPRSGTSIAYKIISDALGADNPSLIESFFFSWAFTKFEQQFAGDCANAFLEYDLAGKFNKVRLESFARPDYDDILTLTRYYYRLAALRYAPARVIDKTPEHIFYWEAILTAFPNAKILFFKRRALDVYASYKKRSRSLTTSEPNADKREWLSIDCDAFAISYRQHMQAANALLMNHRESVLVVDYDKLVARDTTLLDAFSDFIGCELPTLYAALDRPVVANGKMTSALLGGALVENQINVHKYLDEKEIATLCDIPDIFPMDQA